MNHIFKAIILSSLIFFFGKDDLHAQLGVGQEIGIVAGPFAFFSDYGLRYNFETNTGNTGMGIGLAHYLNFAFKTECNCYSMDSYFNDHFKIRSEIDYSTSQLNHFGEIANKSTLRGKKLRAMKGSSEIFEIGAHLEYFPLSIRDYTAYTYPFTPFVSLGANFVSFHPGAYSTLGPLKNNLITEFQGGVDTNSGSAWAIVAGIGARHKLSKSSDLVLNAQWKYYTTDWLDGLNHDNPQNQANDFIFWLNVGYICYLNF